VRRRLGLDPPFGKAAVDDRVLDVLDRDGRIGNAQDARPFARGGAGAAGEFREVVRLVQPIQRVAPAAVIDQVVPLRDQVVDRAAGGALAERHAAIHAAGSLPLEMLLRRMREDLFEIGHPLDRIAVRNRLAGELFESGGFTHATVAPNERPNGGISEH
jgi:hypothetical protein